MDNKFGKGNQTETFGIGYYLWEQEQQRQRIALMPKRIAYAINQFEANQIKYVLKNEQTGHFHCFRKSDNKLFQFYAGTGKIQGFVFLRGINNLIKLLNQ